jgi:hypothetical protein
MRARCPWGDRWGKGKEKYEHRVAMFIPHIEGFFKVRREFRVGEVFALTVRSDGVA